MKLTYNVNVQVDEQGHTTYIIDPGRMPPATCKLAIAHLSKALFGESIAHSNK